MSNSRYPLRCIRHRRLGGGAFAILITLSSCGSDSATSTATVVDAGTTAPIASTVSPMSTAPPSGSAPVPDSTTPAASVKGCRDSFATCLGVLEPGSYQSTRIDLYSTGQAGQLAYDVGEGWANTLDHVPAYWIRPSADYLADPSSDGNGTTSGIYVWADVGAAIQDGSCAEKSDTSVGTEAASLAEWLRQLPGIEVGDQPDESVAGMRALVLDVQYSPTDGVTCDGAPVVPMLASRPGAPDPYVLGIDAGDQMRLMLVDLAPDHTAAIYVAGPAENFSDLMPAAMTVIASFQLAGD